ncbi:MAG: nucleotidyltransferase domain-containing protein [Bacteroidales bacterium]|nr:nucleotidyltransferase domain-containing protein [Bacteroidales bacterium]
MNLIDQNIDKIRDLCSKHKVAKLFVFGSVLSDRFKKNSDIDFIVDFKEIEVYNYADNYFDLKFSLENILKRNIDLLEDKAINNPYLRQSIDSSKQLLYGQ